MSRYTVRVAMTIVAEVDVEADSKDEAQKQALCDYDVIWGQADVVSATAVVIEQLKKGGN